MTCRKIKLATPDEINNQGMNTVIKVMQYDIGGKQVDILKVYTDKVPNGEAEFYVVATTDNCDYPPEWDGVGETPCAAVKSAMRKYMNPDYHAIHAIFRKIYDDYCEDDPECDSGCEER